MLNDADIQRLKKHAHEVNYGSKYATLEQLAAVIGAYESVKAERDALEDERRSMYGYDLAQIWAECQSLKAELARVRSMFPAGQGNLFDAHQ